MSTDISLVVIGTWSNAPGHIVPIELVSIEGLGFSDLYRNLKFINDFGRASLVQLVDECDDPYSADAQFWIPSVEEFRKSLLECSGSIWGSLQRQDEILELIEKFPHAQWYFHVS